MLDSVHDIINDIKIKDFYIKDLLLMDYLAVISPRVWVSSRSWWWTGKPGVTAVSGVAKSWTRLSDWTELYNCLYVCIEC